MKLHYYLLIFLMFWGCGKSEKRIIQKFDNGQPKLVRIYPDRNNQFTYNLIEYYESGQIAFKSFVDNFYFKEMKESFYENGNPKEICYLDDSCLMTNCCPDGTYKLFYENGNLKEIHRLEDGIFQGLVTTFDTTGVIDEEFEVENGFQNGIAKTYYKNGTEESIKTYRNDTLIGTVYYFKENGDSLKRHGTYKGKMSFPIKYWKDNGNSLLGEYYNDDYYQVKWIWINSLGDVTKTEIADTVNGQFVTPDY